MIERDCHWMHLDDAVLIVRPVKDCPQRYSPRPWHRSHAGGKTVAFAVDRPQVERTSSQGQDPGALHITGAACTWQMFCTINCMDAEPLIRPHVHGSHSLGVSLWLSATRFTVGL